MEEDTMHQADDNQSPTATSMGHFLMLPEEIFVPVDMIFNSDIPPSVLLAWLKIFTLVRGPGLGLCVKAEDLAAIIGSRQSTLLRHLSCLQSRSFLKWHFYDQGSNPMVIIMIADYSDVEIPEISSRQHAECNLAEYLQDHSYFPERIMGYISYQDDG